MSEWTLSHWLSLPCNALGVPPLLTKCCIINSWWPRFKLPMASSGTMASFLSNIYYFLHPWVKSFFWLSVRTNQFNVDFSLHAENEERGLFTLTLLKSALFFFLIARRVSSQHLVLTQMLEYLGDPRKTASKQMVFPLVVTREHDELGFLLGPSPHRCF